MGGSIYLLVWVFNFICVISWAMNVCKIYKNGNEGLIMKIIRITGVVIVPVGIIAGFFGKISTRN